MTLSPVAAIFSGVAVKKGKQLLFSTFLLCQITDLEALPVQHLFFIFNRCSSGSFMKDSHDVILKQY